VLFGRINLCTSSDCVKVDAPIAVEVPAEIIKGYVERYYRMVYCRASTAAEPKNWLKLHRIILPDNTIFEYSTITSFFPESQKGKKLRLKLPPKTLLVYAEPFTFMSDFVIYYVSESGKLQLVPPPSVSREDVEVGDPKDYSIRVRYLRVDESGIHYRLPWDVIPNNDTFLAASPYTCEEEVRKDFRKCVLVLDKVVEILKERKPRDFIECLMESMGAKTK